MLEIGNVNTLKVLRKTDIGYMLIKDQEEVFLHFNETNFKELKPHDEVEAFLYFDSQNRLTATLSTPLITTHSFNFIKVVDVNNNLGVFLDMGISKHLLLSKDDLPLDKSLWPRVGDELVTTVVYKNRLRAKLLFHELKEINENQLLTKEDNIEAVVHKVGEAGINLVSKDFDSIFVHKSQVRKYPRVGEKIMVRILSNTERGYTASINPFKEELMVEDANIILDYLIKNKEMNLDSNSHPEEILEIFNMSKKAFKRAIGNLYKRRFIEFKDGKTILVKK